MPPTKKQKVLSDGDDDDDVVIDSEWEKKQGNLKELMIRMEKRMEKMEKMERRQVQIDGKLDALMLYLKIERVHVLQMLTSG